jgi:hypothetical protein
MKKVYICSPYSSKDPAVALARVKASEQYQASLIKQGINGYNPISMHYMALDNELGTAYEHFININHQMIDWCDEVHVIVSDGWKESQGVQGEIAYCAEIGKPITYVVP